MLRMLAQVINASDTACFDESGVCRRMRVSRFGTQFSCSIFDGKELRDCNGTLSGEGELQRLPECLEAEKFLRESARDLLERSGGSECPGLTT